MGLPAIDAAAGAVFLLLATTVVWLAFRLKLKNELLKEILAERESHDQDSPSQQPAQPMQSSPSAPKKPSGFADAFLWKQDPRDALAAAAGRLLNEDKLGELLETQTRFTGLVVLIRFDQDMRHIGQHDGLAQSAERCVLGLLGEKEVACRSSDREFVMICPGARGSQAQHRLNEISEQLWNVQQHCQGAFSILFSWGGIGVEAEPLSNAIASAMDRLQQTKRNRKLRFMGTERSNRRRAI